MIYLRTSIGIEIRREDLLISCLQSNFSGGVFTRFARIEQFRSRERQQVAAEISQFFKSNRLSRENVVLGIPRKDLIIRHLDLPVEVADNLKQVVQYQVQSFEPTEEDKFYFDYVQLNSNEGVKRLLVLLVMVRKSLLDGYLETLAEFGIRPVAVTGSTMGLANIFLETRREVAGKTFLLADITEDGIELSALRDGALVYSRSAVVPAGAALKETLMGAAADAVAKIRLAADEEVEAIILNGDASAAVQQDLGAEAEGTELMSDCLRFEATPATQPHLGGAVTSLGLAHTGMVRRPPLKVNLLPAELRFQQTRWAYIPTIILGATVVGLLAALALRPVFQDRILIRKLDDEIRAMNPRIETVQRIRNQYEGVEKKINFLEGLLRGRDMNLEVLQELTTMLPADTFLQNYVYQSGGTINIAGSSPSAEALIPKLERSPLLKEVTQKGTIFKDAQTGKDRFNFEAKLER